jgi:hypothetical protein
MALGVSYKVLPNVVFKAEGHERKGYGFDRFVNPAGPASTTRYWITSLSVSF